LDLEYEPAKWLGWIRLAANLLSRQSLQQPICLPCVFGHVDAFDRRHVRRVRQIRGHRIENGSTPPMRNRSTG
jgi:hypothetical protein